MSWAIPGSLTRGPFAQLQRRPCWPLSLGSTEAEILHRQRKVNRETLGPGHSGNAEHHSVGMKEGATEIQVSRLCWANVYPILPEGAQLDVFDPCGNISSTMERCPKVFLGCASQTLGVCAMLIPWGLC